MFNYNPVYYSSVKCFPLNIGPKCKEQKIKHSVLISKGPSHPRLSLISDQEGLSVEANIYTSYLVTSIEYQLKNLCCLSSYHEIFEWSSVDYKEKPISTLYKE